jgi:hypothetical protein
MGKNTLKSSDGKYHIGGIVYANLVGSRAQVGHGTAYKTSGGLTKSDLFKNKHDRYVSLKKHRTAKKEKRLEKAGYFTKKGIFGSVKKTSPKKTSSKKRTMRKRK